MPEKCFHIAGLGELLWDLLPDGRQLGGAPANFAYIATLLGNHGIVASRIGRDELGKEAISQLEARSLDCSYVQYDPEHATGTARVSLDSQGKPDFHIAEDVAWDFLAWTPQWDVLAQKVDAVCFGSLAQRSDESRATTRKFLSNTRQDALRVLDVNLRQHYYSAELLSASCELADLVKMNGGEFPEVMQLLGIAKDEIVASARQFCGDYGLKLVCITRGEHGSVLVSKDLTHAHAGISVQVADTVGAGDAFTAGLVHEYLRYMSSEDKPLQLQCLARMNEKANKMGAWVASQQGGMPKAAGTDPKGKILLG